MTQGPFAVQLIRGNVYDYPQYYDILFAADWKAEFRFLKACFAKHAQRRVTRLFEPACGTGRLLVKFAQAGYRVRGNDLNARAVAYCNARFRRRGLPEPACQGDMSDFRLRGKVDAAFNTINSFRHLGSEDAAAAHLRCMAAAVAQGGIYALGFHLTPAGPPSCDEESWSARRGSVAVESRMWTVELHRRRREEWVRMVLDVSTPRQRFRLADAFPFRTYTADQFRRLLAAVPEWELNETYDFTYQIDQPVRVTRQTEDVIYVFRRR
jgi:SAM-dependent methyltransferase